MRMRHGSRARRTAGRIAALAGLVTAFAALPAWAADDEEDAAEEEAEQEEVSEYAENGFYLVGAALYGYPTEQSQLEKRVEDVLSEPADAGDLQGSFGVDGRLGYRIDPRAALEGQFTWIRSFDVRTRTATDDLSGEARFLTGTANAKFFLLTHRIQPYLVLGLGYGWSEIDMQGGDESDSGFVARAGAGVDLYGTRMVALNLEASYLLATGDVDPFDHIAIGAGLTLRFYAE